ncbi:hypothetical protein K1719_034750 [Acacia pycnantha]|nr:hypothetical protein K1719_034750 [Acacia pycnantha]
MEENSNQNHKPVHCYKPKMTIKSANDADVSSPIYSSMRIFKDEAKYTFNLTQPGFHWVRLHFYPIKSNVSDLLKASFSINANKYVMQHNFNVNNNSIPILKEYLINAI